MIALKNVSKSYGKHAVLSNLNLHIDPGSFVCIVGESGSGKTTLTKLLMRAEDPTDGSIEVDGVNIRTLPAPVLQLYRRRLGVIFQEPILLDHANLAENIGLPLLLLGAPQALIVRNVADLLKRMDMTSKAALRPDELSLSERSLACIARALITAPMVVIADGPAHNLDDAQKDIAKELFTNMHKKGTTMVFTSRDGHFAKSMHAEIIDLSAGKTNKESTATPAKNAPSEAHRILEEEKPIEQILANEPSPPPPNPDDKNTKRIRITSIGSN